MRPRINVQRCLFPLFVVLVLLFTVTRLQVFVRFNLQYIDTDQPYMWLGAVDYAKGRFYEPRYYGQSYNTFLEALSVVPLVWLKVPVYISVPAATHFLSAFPFLFTAVYLFYRGRKSAGIFVMALLLAMPPEYDLLNGLPRGFVSGLFFCSFFVISFLGPGRMKWVVINTILAVAGCFINPNAAVVVAAFFVFVTLHNLQWNRLLTIGATAVISGLCCYVLFDLFYRLHPEYIKNPITLGITTAYFMENISNLDHRFAHISPFTSGNCWPLLFLLFVLGFMLASTSRKAFFGFVAGLAVVLFSFCVGKTTEGTAWVFVSFSRMYLGIPFLIALTISFIRFSDLMIYFLLVPVGMGIYKLSALEERIRREIDPGRWVGVRVYELSMALRYRSFPRNSKKKRCRTGYCFSRFLAEQYRRLWGTGGHGRFSANNRNEAG